MRIAIVSESFPPVSFGGGELSALHFAEALAREVSVEVVTIDFGKRLDTAPYPVRYLTLPQMPAWSGDDPRALYGARGAHPAATIRNYLSFARQLARLVREHGYDIVHTQGMHSAIAAYLSRGRHQARLVTTVRAFTPLAGSWRDEVLEKHVGPMPEPMRFSPRRAKRRAARELRRRTLEQLDAAFTVSRFVKDVYVGCEALDPERTATLYNIPPKPPSGIDRAALRDDLGFDARVVFSATSRLTPGKGVFTLLEAMRFVLQRFPDARLVIAGGGDPSKVEQRIAELGIAPAVELAGYVENERLLRMMYAADIVTMPSQHHEPLGRPLLEAIAVDRPIVATSTGGTPELLTHGCNGLLVEPLSVGSLAEGLQAALGDDELPHRSAAHNRELRGTVLEPSAIVEHALSWYERVRSIGAR
jgi:glycosyltransferase involved in cell wall biosynthesis